MLAEARRDEADVILIGTGCEVQLAVAAREALAAEGIAARVVSMPDPKDPVRTSTASKVVDVEGGPSASTPWVGEMFPVLDEPALETGPPAQFLERVDR